MTGMSGLNWNAISAIATFGYLVISVLLWKSTKDSVRESKRAANAAHLAAEAARQQAEVAQRSFELNRKTILDDRKPVVWVKDPTLKRFNTGEGFSFSATLRNDGRSIARELHWHLEFGDQSSTWPAAEKKSNALEIVPGGEIPISGGVSDRVALDRVKDAGYLEAILNVRYESIYDDPTNKTMIRVRLELRDSRVVIVRSQTAVSLEQAAAQAGH